MQVINAYKDDSFNYKIHIYGNFNDVNHKLDDLIENYSSVILFIDSYIEDRNEVNEIYNLCNLVGNKKNIKIYKKLIESGKHSKNFKTIELIIDWLIKRKIQRDSLFIGIGGGVIGDLVGFLSSIYYRGVDLCHVPTNITAMTDSSIGGKTAINTKMHVNSCGSYKHPVMTLINTNFLATLPDRELRAGFAEILKIALLKKGKLQRILNNKNKNILNLLSDGNIIKDAIEYKLHFTSSDIDEKRKRLFLNIGHTFGHSIESVQNLDTEEYYRHGEAVSLGLISASVVSDLVFGSNLEYKISNLLSSFGLPTRIPRDFFDKTKFLNKESLINQLVKIAFTDKKGVQGQLRLILMEDLFKPVIYQTSDGNLLKQGFSKLLENI